MLIAGSDVLFRCDPDFSIRTFSRNRYLDDCHEICRYEDKVFLTSPGFDSLLAFDLGTREYVWGYHLIRQYGQWAGHTFDPRSNMGPVPVNDYHINMVHVDGTGIYFSGLRTEALLASRQRHGGIRGVLAARPRRTMRGPFATACC